VNTIDEDSSNTGKEIVQVINIETGAVLNNPESKQAVHVKRSPHCPGIFPRHIISNGYHEIDYAHTDDKGCSHHHGIYGRHMHGVHHLDHF
ncbi:hypothetical protein CWI39_1968p0010, partial [Hamiltosporidium magnivora]